MKKLYLLLAAATLPFSLAACDTLGGQPSLGNTAATACAALDSRKMLAAETLYTAAARSAATAIRTGVVTSPAAKAHIGKMDLTAYGALRTLRTAYATCNLAAFEAALATANSTRANLIDFSSGDH